MSVHSCRERLLYSSSSLFGLFLPLVDIHDHAGSVIFRACAEVRPEDPRHPRFLPYTLWATLANLRAARGHSIIKFLVGNLHTVTDHILCRAKTNIYPFDTLRPEYDAVLAVLRDFYKPELRIQSLSEEIRRAADIDCEDALALARGFVLQGMKSYQL